MFRILVYMFFVLFVTNAYAGPFGINMGQSLSELDTIGKGFRVYLHSVPKPHRKFEKYFVWASNQTGVCLIGAQSFTHDNDPYGNLVKNDMSNLADALDKKYGSHKINDVLYNGALYDNPEEWVQAISKGERKYFFDWKNPRANNEEIFKKIQLSVAADDYDRSIIFIRYHSKDIDKCVSEMEAEENDSL